MTQRADTQQAGTVELEKTSDSAQRDWTHPVYQTNEFKMYCWKILPCTNQEEHDYSECPFAHLGENNVRRDPRIYKYRPEACPATQSKNGRCSVGVHCHLAHNVFERWLHPQRFRTQMCRDGSDCKRKHTCFFAHYAEELRVVPDLGLVTNSSSTAAGSNSPIASPPACPSPSAKRTSSINSNSSSAFALPESPASLSRSSSSSNSHSRASSTVAMSPLSGISRQSSFQGAQSPPLNSRHQQLSALDGPGAGLPRGHGHAWHGAQAGYNKQLGLQPGLSGPMSGYQAGLSGPMTGYQAGLSGPFLGPQTTNAQVQTAALALQLQQQWELQQSKQQQLEQLQLQMLWQQQTAFPQPDLPALLKQQVAVNIQQAAQACAAAKAAKDQLAILQAALGNNSATSLPMALQQAHLAAAADDMFCFSAAMQPSTSGMAYNHGSSSSSCFGSSLGGSSAAAPLATSPMGAAPANTRQDDMLLALLLAQQQQPAQALFQAAHVPAAPVSSGSYGFQPGGNSHQATHLAARMAATAATHVPTAAVAQLGAQPPSSLYA